MPEVVDDTERLITIVLGTGEYAKGDEVVQLSDGHATDLRFRVGAVWAFNAPVDDSGNATSGKLALHAITHSRGPVSVTLSLFSKPLNGVRKGFGVEIEECEVFQLGLEEMQADATGEGSEDIQRLACFGVLLGWRHGGESAQIMQTVGELEQDDAGILAHGEEELAHGFDLHAELGAYAEDGRGIRGFDGREFGNAIHDARDDRPKASFDIILSEFGVFDGVMQEGSGDSLSIHGKLGENASDSEGMLDIRLAGFAPNTTMGDFSDTVGIADERKVLGGHVAGTEV